MSTAVLRSNVVSRLLRSSARVWGASASSRVQAPLLRSEFPSFLPGPANFCSRRYLSSAGETLKDILAREVNEEINDGRAEMPAELADLKASIEQDWKIVDDGATTRLYRTVGSSKVIVSFHCQDTVEGEEYELEAVDGEEPAVPFRFEVIISKAGNTMVIGCISNAGETTIDGVTIATDDAETILANGIGRLKYQGPEFPELAEDLQDAFHDYIESELGVNEDVSAFVSMFADFKEQNQYVKFLEDASKIL